MNGIDGVKLKQPQTAAANVKDMSLEAIAADQTNMEDNASYENVSRALELVKSYKEKDGISAEQVRNSPSSAPLPTPSQKPVIVS